MEAFKNISSYEIKRSIISKIYEVIFFRVNVAAIIIHRDYNKRCFPDQN